MVRRHRFIAACTVIVTLLASTVASAFEPGATGRTSEARTNHREVRENAIRFAQWVVGEAPKQENPREWARAVFDSARRWFAQKDPQALPTAAPVFKAAEDHLETKFPSGPSRRQARFAGNQYGPPADHAQGADFPSAPPRPQARFVGSQNGPAADTARGVRPTTRPSALNRFEFAGGPATTRDQRSVDRAKLHALGRQIQQAAMNGTAVPQLDEALLARYGDSKLTRAVRAVHAEATVRVRPQPALTTRRPLALAPPPPRR